MTSKRSDLGLGDLGRIEPSPPAQRPDPQAVRAAAEAVGFVSRAPAPSAKPSRRPRRRRTGRTAQVSIRLRPETLQAFYDYCDANDLGLGEAFERALALLLAEGKCQD